MVPVFNENTVHFPCSNSQELRSAKQFIHLEYFIIKEGCLLDEITEILESKAKEGVKIRLLYDDFGCVDLSNRFPLHPSHILHPLKE